MVAPVLGRMPQVLSGHDGALIGADFALVTPGDHDGFDTGMDEGLLGCRLYPDKFFNNETWFQIENPYSNDPRTPQHQKRRLGLPGDPLPTWPLAHDDDPDNGNLSHRMRYRTRPLRLFTAPPTRQAYLVGIEEVKHNAGNIMVPKVYRVSQLADGYMSVGELTITTTAMETTNQITTNTICPAPYAFAFDRVDSTTPANRRHYLYWMTVIENSSNTYDRVVFECNLLATQPAWTMRTTNQTGMKVTGAGQPLGVWGGTVYGRTSGSDKYMYAFEQNSGTNTVISAWKVNNSTTAWSRSVEKTLGGGGGDVGSYTMNIWNCGYPFNNPGASPDEPLEYFSLAGMWMQGRSATLTGGSLFVAGNRRLFQATVTDSNRNVTTPQSFDRYDRDLFTGDTMLDNWAPLDYRLGIGLFQTTASSYDISVRTLKHTDRRFVFRPNSPSAGNMPCYITGINATGTDAHPPDSHDNEGAYVLFGGQDPEYF